LIGYCHSKLSFKKLIKKVFTENPPDFHNTKIRKIFHICKKIKDFFCLNNKKFSAEGAKTQGAIEGLSGGIEGPKDFPKGLSQHRKRPFRTGKQAVPQAAAKNIVKTII